MTQSHSHWQPLSFPVLVSIALFLTGFVYLRGWFRLRSAFPQQATIWRLLSFTGGLCFLWIVLGSPASTLDHHSLTVHMINHLLLMLVVAPLFIAGAPFLPLSFGLPTSLGRTFRRLIRHNALVQWLAGLFRHPVFCWVCAAGAVIGWHIPAVFQLAMRSNRWHDVEYASFTLAGLLFWRPVMQPDAHRPQWFIPIYLFLATLPCDILSAFLAFCDRLVYPAYAFATGLFNLSPLQDQHCAAALMWVSVTIAYLLPAAVITVKMLSPRHTHSQLQVQAVSDKLPSRLSSSEAEVA
jgi:putative membrane protein